MKEEYSIQIQAVIYNNSKRALLKCLESFSNAVMVAGNKGVKIGARFVYGDASENAAFTSEELEDLENRFKETLSFSYKFFGFNSGFGKGQNILAENCLADYILIINPDIIVSPDFFLEIMKPFDDEKVGEVEARQCPIEHNKYYATNTFETQWASLACSAVRTELFKKLNGIDSESFFMYCEDVDFSWRIRREGYKVLYCPSAMAYHAKRYDNLGYVAASRTEFCQSRLSALVLAYKWSKDRELKKIYLKTKLSPDSCSQEAVREFDRRKSANSLPERIEDSNDIAVIYGEGIYAKNRFQY